MDERLGYGERLQDINKHTRETKRRSQRGASQHEYKNSPIIDANVDDRVFEIKGTFDHPPAVVTTENVFQKKVADQVGWGHTWRDRRLRIHHHISTEDVSL